MVSYAYLNEADFSKLATCAESWKLMKKKYGGIGEQFEQQVVKRLQTTWEGDAATKAFHHMSTVTKQYVAAGTEAARMGKLMAEAHDEFTTARKKLHTLQEDAGTDHFKIHDTGTIEDVDPMWDSPTASSQPGWAEERRRKQEGFADRLEQVLRHATQFDQNYAAAFKSDFNGEDEQGFNKSGYSSDDQAREAQEEADQAAKLIDKDGRLTETELNQLDSFLAEHKGDPHFAARFAQKAGAEDTLDRYNQIINPPQGTRLTDAQLKRIQSLQGNLGSTLGTATTVNDSAMYKFEQDLLAATDRNFNANPTESPYGLSGYQLTSSLMSQGDWDDNLLQDYGEKLIAKEQLSAGFQNPDAIWGQNRTVGITGIPALDPMTGFMDALGHNPDASLEFLDGSTHTDGGESVDNLDYLMKDRHWPEGAGFTGDDKNPDGISTLGHAMESAATGMPYDYDGPTMPPHTPDQAGFVNELVSTLGTSENADLINGDGRLAPIKDSLGEITANYMGDFQQSLTTVDLPINGTHVGGSDGIDRGDAVNFLSSVGQDPEAYKTINAAQLGYTQGLVDESLAHRDPGAGFDRMQDRVINLTAPGSCISGIMSEARAEAVYEHHVAEAQDFNNATKDVNRWVGYGVGIATGAIASPAAGSAVTVGYGELSNLVMGHIQKDNAAEGDFEARDVYASGQKSHEVMINTMVEKSAGEHGYDEYEARDMADTAAREAKQSFSSGSDLAYGRG
ncbi:hypothetical protein N566_20115 [Streptomycetaceae bacterium MP113-05]|nr:hypothetical protein N566_20115 [Streptomycetaceae bacterium MP113-05]